MMSTDTNVHGNMSEIDRDTIVKDFQENLTKKI